ncbi:hypothetical protein COBT_003763, partial [Conglomerata obtusa]
QKIENGYKIYVSSNYCVNSKKNSPKEYNKAFYTILLYHTVSIVALETFELNLTEQTVNYYFNNDTSANPNNNDNFNETNESVRTEDDLQDKIYCICVMFYRELTLWFDKMGIENVENIYTFYAFFNNIFECLKYYSLYNEKIIESFYKEFVNKKICLEIFKNYEFGGQNTTDAQIETKKKLDGFYIEKILDGSIINPLNLQITQNYVDKKEANEGGFNSDDSYAICSILLTCGIRAILTSVASYITTTEYVYYLSKVSLKLNNQANTNNDIIMMRKEKNLLRKDNTKLLFFEYSSNKFQTVVEETYANDKSLEKDLLSLFIISI